MSAHELEAPAIRFANKDQHHAYLALGRLLNRAAKAGLPTLAWTVPPHSTAMLVGEVAGGWLTDAEKQEVYDRWLAFFPDVKHNEDHGYGTTVNKSFVPQNVPWLRHTGEDARPSSPEYAWMYRTNVIIRVALGED